MDQAEQKRQKLEEKQRAHALKQRQKAMARQQKQQQKQFIAKANAAAGKKQPARDGIYEDDLFDDDVPMLEP
jgi:hypothetical protein